MRKQLAGGLLSAAAALGLLLYGLLAVTPDWCWVVMGACAGLSAGLLTGYVLNRRASGHMKTLTKAAAAISAGDYACRVSVLPGPWRELSEAVNAMAEGLQRAEEDFKRQRAQMKGVLEGMDDGVVAVDADGLLLLCNDRAAVLLERELTAGQPLEGNEAAMLLAERLRGSIHTATAGRETLTLSDGRMLEVYFAPIRRMKGALAVLADVTKLRKLETMRSQFVANVTHELKTPLTSIMGYIELLKGEPREEAVRLNFYEIMQIEAERLQNLIDDLLLLSEIENNPDVHLQSCSVGEILEQTLRSLEPLAGKCGVTLRAKAQPDLYMTANPLRLRQLFTNLLDNAVKYNRPGGFVEAGLSRQGDELVLRISDSGIGIDPVHFERLFERFYRVDKSRSREMGGTGLGLSIVKHIVQLYGGEIQVESSPGEGSVFTVRLPARAEGEERQAQSAPL